MDPRAASQRARRSTAAIGDYLKGLNPGDTVVYQHVLAEFFVDGVHSVTNLLIQKNAQTPGTADISLATGATPEVASTGTISLS